MNDDTDQHPESPCTNVCVMDPDTGWCRGCLRTLDEIARWSTMTAAEQWGVLGELESRRTETEKLDG